MLISSQVGVLVEVFPMKPLYTPFSFTLELTHIKTNALIQLNMQYLSWYGFVIEYKQQKKGDVGDNTVNAVPPSFLSTTTSAIDVPKNRSIAWYLRHCEEANMPDRCAPLRKAEPWGESAAEQDSQLCCYNTHHSAQWTFCEWQLGSWIQRNILWLPINQPHPYLLMMTYLAYVCSCLIAIVCFFFIIFAQEYYLQCLVASSFPCSFMKKKTSGFSWRSTTWRGHFCSI